MPLKKTRKPPPQHYFFLFGIAINLNSILTTFIGAIVVFLISTGLHMIHSNLEAQRALIADVRAIKAEQARVKKEYHPEIHRDLPYVQPEPTP